MCTVSEIMTRNVLSVAADASAKDLAWGFNLKGFSGAPVKDDSGNVVGVVSKSDLLDPDKTDSDSTSGTVRDHMTPVLLAVRANDSYTVAVRRMVDMGIHRLMVVDDAGGLVGIVTPMDVLRGLLDGRVRAG